MGEPHTDTASQPRVVVTALQKGGWWVGGGGNSARKRGPRTAGANPKSRLSNGHGYRLPHHRRGSAQHVMVRPRQISGAWVRIKPRQNSGRGSSMGGVAKDRGVRRWVGVKSKEFKASI